MLSDSEEEDDPPIPYIFCSYSTNQALQYAYSKDYL